MNSEFLVSGFSIVIWRPESSFSRWVTLNFCFSCWGFFFMSSEHLNFSGDIWFLQSFERWADFLSLVYLGVGNELCRLSVFFFEFGSKNFYNKYFSSVLVPRLSLRWKLIQEQIIDSYGMLHSIFPIHFMTLWPISSKTPFLNLSLFSCLTFFYHWDLTGEILWKIIFQLALQWGKIWPGQFVFRRKNFRKRKEIEAFIVFMMNMRGKILCFLIQAG